MFVHIKAENKKRKAQNEETKGRRLEVKGLMTVELCLISGGSVTFFSYPLAFF